MKLSLSIAATCIVGLAALGAMPARAALPVTHSYEFSGTLSDDLGGPSMSYAVGANNAFVGAGPSAGLHFADNQGPNVSGAFANSDVYSMEMYFSLENLDNYRRLVDVKDGTSDTGMYFYGGALLFYSGATHISKGVGATPGSMAHLVVTRDATDTVSAYYNGALAFSFADTSDLMTLSGPGRIVRFFDDDGSEGSNGFVDYIHTYDEALGAAEVAAAYNGGTPARVARSPSAAPEPGAWTLMIAGFAGVGSMLRTRRRSALA